MTRSVTPWAGKSDDEAVPTRVKLRVFERAKGHCAICGRRLHRWQLDHIVPLSQGGRHAEDNLQCLCSEPCHAAKTGRDAKLKAKSERIRTRHAGIRKPSRFPCAKTSPWKKRLNGEVVRR